MNKVSGGSKFSESLLAEIRELNLGKSITQAKNSTEDTKKSSSSSFFDQLTDSIKKTNDLQIKADKMATDISTGKEQNIHETMLAATHAELSFNLMVQVRNKALEAYHEVMRMPV